MAVCAQGTRPQCRYIDHWPGSYLSRKLPRAHPLPPLDTPPILSIHWAGIRFDNRWLPTPGSRTPTPSPVVLITSISPKPNQTPPCPSPILTTTPTTPQNNH